MLEVIQSKVTELEQKINQETGFVAQLKHTIKQAREQVKTRDAEIHKLRGAIEAFMATCNALKQTQPQTVDAVAEAKPDVENGSI